MEDLADVGAMFRALAEIDFRDRSPLYEQLALAAAEDPEVLSLLLPASPSDRFPHLLMASVQHLLLGEGTAPLEAFAGTDPYPLFRDWSLGHRDEIEALTAARVVQTNEVARCAGLMPCLAAVAEATGQPLALLEVGSSAGLNLLFDRYRYDFGPGRSIGSPDASVVVRPRIDGTAPVVAALPEVAWRRGLDRNPVDVTDDDAVRWLRACIWPEQQARRELLDQAVAVARQDPPTIVQGDALEALGDLARSAPEDAALCVSHSAVLAYLPDPARFGERLAEVAEERPLWWVSGEPPGFVPPLAKLGPAPARNEAGHLAFNYGIVPLNVPGQEPRAVAAADPHGIWLTGA
jgi:hypothetical protein